MNTQTLNTTELRAAEIQALVDAGAIEVPSEVSGEFAAMAARLEAMGQAVEVTAEQCRAAKRNAAQA